MARCRHKNFAGGGGSGSAPGSPIHSGSNAVLDLSHDPLAMELMEELHTSSGRAPPARSSGGSSSGVSHSQRLARLSAASGGWVGISHSQRG